MGGDYEEELDSRFGTMMHVDFQTIGPEVIGYSVVLVVAVAGRIETIRVYDSAHGFNEMHRYRQGLGKSSGKRFHSGTLGKGMRSAIEDIKQGHEAMVEGWKG